MTAGMTASSNEFQRRFVQTQQPENKERKKGKLAPGRRRFRSISCSARMFPIVTVFIEHIF